ncbi:MAG: hypothetical protein C0478_09950, partial [Planctomyces sp.]|nr:hypothetical protein [Planctomyces sp.]
MKDLFARKKTFSLGNTARHQFMDFSTNPPLFLPRPFRWERAGVRASPNVFNLTSRLFPLWLLPFPPSFLLPLRLLRFSALPLLRFSKNEPPATHKERSGVARRPATIMALRGVPGEVSLTD